MIVFPHVRSCNEQLDFGCQSNGNGVCLRLLRLVLLHHCGYLCIKKSKMAPLLSVKTFLSHGNICIENIGDAWSWVSYRIRSRIYWVHYSPDLREKAIRQRKVLSKLFLSNTNHNVARRTVFPKMLKEQWLVSLRRGYKQVASYGLISFLYGYEEEDIWSKSLKKNYRKENAVKEVMELAKEVSKYSWKYRRFWAVITLDNAFNSAS